MWNFTEEGVVIISALFLQSEIVKESHCWGLGVIMLVTGRQKY